MREHVDDDLATSTTRDESGDAGPATGDPTAAVAAGDGIGSGDDGGDDAAPKRRRGRPKGSAAKTTRVVTMTLTVSGSADGEWQAELKQGSSWVTRGLPVSAAAVSQAAAALHADLAGPVDEVIETARASKAARVAELEAELEHARKALADLEQ
ncbi:DUF6319 family protein [Pseudonocardia nantongensis]|uniref:DUF6319 family protein n=1 Tax=Pseudonocardia nantongensis TaxID=1181885 RepID=UPI00397E007A